MFLEVNDATGEKKIYMNASLVAFIEPNAAETSTVFFCSTSGGHDGQSRKVGLSAEKLAVALEDALQQRAVLER